MIIIKEIKINYYVLFQGNCMRSLLSKLRKENIFDREVLGLNFGRYRVDKFKIKIILGSCFHSLCINIQFEILLFLIYYFTNECYLKFLLFGVQLVLGTEDFLHQLYHFLLLCCSFLGIKLYLNLDKSIEKNPKKQYFQRK